VHSLPDSQRMRDALDALDLVVVIDVAFTETARHADYVLPAASQFEKWEATFFTLEFPENAFQLRRPLLPAKAGTLGEPEIHRRLVRALGALNDDDLVPLDAAATDRQAYADAFLTMMIERPDLARLAPILLYETLGPLLPEGAEAAAAVWGLAQTTALTYPESIKRAGYANGDELFDAVMASPSGVVFTVDEFDESWARLDTADGRIHLVVEDLVPELVGLATEPERTDADFPFVLSAGERRSFTANTIFRDPEWRKKDRAGALRMHPDDAARLAVDDGGRVRVTTARGSVEATVECSDTMRPGHVSLPNGRGLDYPDEAGARSSDGVSPNELTSSGHRDWLAGTPWHKFVPARVEAVGSPPDQGYSERSDDLTAEAIA
jgi:anaerobic selenocysteine-containing dehydrogenase